MTDLFKRAFQLEAQGVTVFPTCQNKKRPPFKYKNLKGPEGSGERQERLQDVKDLTGLLAFFTHLPEGYTVLDFDFAQQSQHREVMEMLGLDPENVHQVSTTSGGLHLYLKYPRAVSFPNRISTELSDGTVAPLDILGSGKSLGLMLPGSKAINKAGELGDYRAIGEGTEDDIYNLSWTECTEEQRLIAERILQAKSESNYGIDEKPEGSAASTGSASIAFAQLVEHLIPQLRKGFDTNPVCTNLGAFAGSFVHTSTDSRAIMEDCWMRMLGVLSEDDRSQVIADDRHKESFMRMGMASYEITQERIRSRVAEARAPAAVQVEGAFEKEVYALFNGAVGVRLGETGRATFGLLRDAGYARLKPADWDDPETLKMNRDQAFSTHGSLTFTESLLVKWGIQSREIPDSFGHNQKSFRTWLLQSSRTDESEYENELSRLQEAYLAFDPDAWERDFQALKLTHKKYPLHWMAPEIGGKRTTAFMALLPTWEVPGIAVPPDCSLPDPLRELLGDPIAERKNKRGRTTYVYDIPEVIRDV